jgi:hypothetical protein
VAARTGHGRDYLLSFQKSKTSEEQIFAMHWGDEPSMIFQIANNTAWFYEMSTVAWGKVGSMFVYEGESQIFGMYRHIYGSQWAPHAVFLPLEIRN